MGKRIHVVPHHGDWSVRRDGAQRSSGIFSTQAEARDFARGIARRDRLELDVHGRNGQIREATSYGHDPYPPKG